MNLIFWRITFNSENLNRTTLLVVIQTTHMAALTVGCHTNNWLKTCLLVIQNKNLSYKHIYFYANRQCWLSCGLFVWQLTVTAAMWMIFNRIVWYLFSLSLVISRKTKPNILYLICSNHYFHTLNDSSARTYRLCGFQLQGSEKWIAQIGALLDRMPSVEQIKLWKYGKICHNTYN